MVKLFTGAEKISPSNVRRSDQEAQLRRRKSMRTKKPAPEFFYIHYAYAALCSLVDDGALYSTIGNAELGRLTDVIGDTSTVELEPIPHTLAGTMHWQYGTGEHSSAPRRVLGFVLLTAKSDNGRVIGDQAFCAGWLHVVGCWKESSRED